MSSLETEVVLAAGYALFLLALAAGLDLLARDSHRRSERYRTAGFRYHEHLDAWECPEGQHLWLHEHDHERRLRRYRGKPHICNACPRKQDCTDSDQGREIVRFLDEWPRLEAGRFHRGLGAMLIALAAVIAIAALIRNHQPAELAALASVLLLTGLVGRHLAPAPRTSPGPGERGIRSGREAARRVDPALARPPSRPGPSEAASPGGGAPGR
jgi:hypothetical protein